MPTNDVVRHTGPTGQPTDTTYAVGFGFNSTDKAFSVNEAGTLYAMAAKGGWQFAEVSVSIAEMLAVRATPKTLVAAPGAGKVLIFHEAAMIYDYAAVYTESSDDLVIRYTDGSGAIASTTLDTTNFLDQTSDQIRTFKTITTDLTPVANAPLVLHNSGNGELGGTGSPCRIKIWFSVWETGL